MLDSEKQNDKSESHFSFRYQSGILQQAVITVVRTDSPDSVHRALENGKPDRAANMDTISGLLPDIH